MAKGKVEQVENKISLHPLGESGGGIVKFESLRVFEALGGIKAISHAANALNSQALEALKTFQEQELWRQIPFDDTRNCINFDEFLSVHGPFGKTKYYQMRELMEKEGSQAFDTLTALGIPYERRKLLQRGTIGVDGDEVVIDNERVPITNARRIKIILATLTEKISQQEDKIVTGEATVKRLKDEVRSARAAGERTVTVTPTWDVRLAEVLIALGALRTAIDQSPVTAEQRKLIVDRIADQMHGLHEALGLAVEDDDEFDDDGFDDDDPDLSEEE
jgi:hypothetical protein